MKIKKIIHEEPGQELQIQSAVPITDVHKFHMEVHKNTHAVVYMEGTIPQEAGDDAVLQPLAGTPVTVGADDRLLFAGMLKEVQMTHEGAGYRVSLTGISSTEQLAHEKKNRSFQDRSMTYREVMEQVLADTQGARLWFYGEDRPIENPLYQIEETDWAFLKRLAGSVNTVLVPDVYSALACVYSNMPTGELREADDTAVCDRLWFDRRSRSICRRIRTDRNWEMGDRVEWEDGRYIISSKECSLEKGILQFYYTLEGRDAFRAECRENPYLTGLMLPAVVLDVRQEEIKVKFDMDTAQPEETACWYPWQPDMGNLAYCMPEKGERVYVHIGKAAGGEDRVLCGIRANGAGNPELKNTHRYFTTGDGKRLYMEPDAMGFQDMKQTKPLELRLSDAAGVNMASCRSLTITAKETVGLKGADVLFEAPKEISLVKRAASPTVINMCNGFDTIGGADRVTTDGGGGDAFPVFHRDGAQYEEEYAFTDRGAVERSIIGSTPVKELEDGLERQLEGCQVKRLGLYGIQ